MKHKKTERGFSFFEFEDSNKQSCNVQESSRGGEPCIWMGLDKVMPQMLIKGIGWCDYPISDEVHISTRMHLSQKQVKELIPILQKFVSTGEIEND